MHRFAYILLHASFYVQPITCILLHTTYYMKDNRMSLDVSYRFPLPLTNRVAASFRRHSSRSISPLSRCSSSFLKTFSGSRPSSSTLSACRIARRVQPVNGEERKKKVPHLVGYKSRGLAFARPGLARGFLHSAGSASCVAPSSAGGSRNDSAPLEPSSSSFSVCTAHVPHRTSPIGSWGSLVGSVCEVPS